MGRKALYVGAGLDLNIINKLFLLKILFLLIHNHIVNLGKRTALYDYDYYYCRIIFYLIFYHVFSEK